MMPPDIFGPDFGRDPYGHYRQMRDAFPLYRHEAANAYILSRYEDVSAALRDPNFTTRSYAAQIEPLLGVTIVQRDGIEHARQRRLLAAPLRADRFEALFHRRLMALADRLIDRFRDRGDVELVSEFVTPFAVEALATVVGLPTADLDRFRAWYTALLRFGVNLVGDPDIARAGFAARDELEAYLGPLLAERRRSPAPGLLSLLLHAEADGERLTDDEVLRFTMLMIFAGGETVEKTAATFLRNLIEHPDQLARLRRDRTLMDRALAESLRYTAPTHMVPRRTRADVAVSGGRIPAESEVLCFLASANRDERHFPAPDVFDICREHVGTRHHLGHASFGMGRHLCLGAAMAKIEVAVAVNRLLDAMPALTFTDGEAPPDQGLFLRGPARLALRFEPACQPALSEK